MKKALVTGVLGQDGLYLSEFLLSNGYQVIGVYRPTTSSDRQLVLDRLSTVPNLRLMSADITDYGRMAEVVYTVKPDEVYNLAAQSHVRVSFDNPLQTMQVTGIGALNMLEATHTFAPNAKFYQASSSEQFGNSPAPQGEETPMSPCSPYAVAKLSAYWSVRGHRHTGLFASNGILHNHESPRRGVGFVTRKICVQIVEILSGKREKLSLGNLNARRDFGYAPEYVVGMWKILQHSEPDDFVLGTGVSHSIRDFVNSAAKYVGIPVKNLVTQDIAVYRPNEVHDLRADNGKARTLLQWGPQITFENLVRIMIDHECHRQGVPAPGEGFVTEKRLVTSNPLMQFILNPII